jgi:hypothetical protein
MTDYRCYLLDAYGAIRGVVPMACDGDDRAVARARDLLVRRPEYSGFELWQRDRRVHVEETAIS